MGIQAEKAAMISGPIVTANAQGVLTADPTGITGVLRYALTGVAQSAQLPLEAAHPQKRSTLGKRFIRVLAVGANVQLAQGQGSAPTVVLNQVAAFGTGHVNAGATCVNGVEKEFEIDPRATHLGWVGDAGAAGFLEFFVSDGPGRL